MDDAASIKDWLGRTQCDEDEIALGAVQRLAATLDQDPGAFKRGTTLPESWYAILFGTLARQRDLGPEFGSRSMAATSAPGAPLTRTTAA